MSSFGCLPIYALMTANAISYIGNRLTSIAVPWFVLQTTDSAAKTGITAAVTVIPTILAGIFGGALVDRLGFKRMSIASDMASGVAVAMIPLLHVTVGIAFWQLLVLMFLSALLDVPGGTARQSMVPDLAAAGGMTLERANSAFASVDRASQLAAPLVAGFLIAIVGAANVLWIDAATFAASAGVVAVAIPGMWSVTKTEGYFRELAAGFRFLAANPLLLSLLAIASMLNFTLNPLIRVVLPVYAREEFESAAQLGLLIGSNAVGLLIGVVLYGAVGDQFSRRWIYLGSFAVAPIPLIILASTPGLIISLLALGVLGMLFGPGSPIFFTVFHERVPERMRGRIFGLIGASVWLILPVGMLVAGAFIEWFGLRTMLLIDAMVLFMVSLSMIMNPALRDMDSKP